MGVPRPKESKERQIFETGTEPEYVVHDISKHEEAGDGLIRLYLTTARSKFDKVEYTVVGPPETLIRIARHCEQIAREYLRKRSRH